MDEHHDFASGPWQSNGRPRARAARRMLAIALVLEGKDRKTAAETCGMDRQTLCAWVHRYNAEGLAGLKPQSIRAAMQLPAMRRPGHAGAVAVPEE